MIKEPKVLISERSRWLFFGLPFTFTKYTINEKKMIINKGFFNSTEEEILLYRIVDLSMSRTLIQKLFKLGTVTIHSQDTTSPTLVIKNIKNVSNFKNILSDAIEKDKIRLRIRRSEIIDTDGTMSDMGGDFSDYNDSYLL